MHSIAVRILVDGRMAGRALLTGAVLFGACLASLLYAYAWEFEPGAADTFARVAPFAAIGALLALAALTLCTAAFDSRAERLQALAASALTALAAVAFMKMCQLYFDFAVDDAFITFRYARNLALGAGPTFNAAGEPVEGYTTFLWMLIMAVPHAIGTDAPLFAKLLGLALGLGTLVATALLVLESVDSDSPARAAIFGGFAALCLAAFYPMAIHAISGMETMLFAFLLAALVLCAARHADDDSRPFAPLPVLCLLLGLTRPEGNLIALVVLAFAFRQSPAPLRLRRILTALALYVLPGAAYFAWRWSYYGLPFPLSFYMKLAGARNLAGAEDVGDFLLTVIPPVSLFILMAFKGAGRKIWLTASAAAALLGFYLFPKPIVSFDWRFVFPAAPLLFALAGIGAFRLVDILRRAGTDLGPAYAALLAVGIGLAALSHLPEVQQTRPARRADGAAMNAYRFLGRLLKDFPAPEPPTLAIGDAGAIPYYSEWKTLDYYGLNDAHVMLAGSLNAAIAYVLNNHPDLIVITFNDPENPVQDRPGTKALYEATLAAGFKEVGAFKVGSTYYLWLFTPPGSPLGDYLKQALR